MAQVVEHLPHKCGAFSSKLQHKKKEKKDIFSDRAVLHITNSHHFDSLNEKIQVT
jgi:hypothetical protein